MFRIAAFRPPVFAWLVIAVSVGVGAYMHWRSPTGLFLYTSSNWCTGVRTNAFVLGYLSVVLLAAAGSAAAWLVSKALRYIVRTPDARARLASISSRFIAALAALLCAAVLTPVLQFAFPLKPDPACVGQGPGPAK